MLTTETYFLDRKQMASQSTTPLAKKDIRFHPMSHSLVLGNGGDKMKTL